MEIPIRSNKDLKAFSLRRRQQVAVTQSAPTALKCGFDLMRTQEFPQGNWSPLIEENPHSGDLGQRQALGCVVEDRAHLLDGDAREMFHKLSDLYAVFEVFKES